MDKSSKKSDVGAVKVSMLFAGGNKTSNNDLSVKTVDYYSQIIVAAGTQCEPMLSSKFLHNQF